MSKLTKKQALELTDRMLEAYPEEGCALHYGSNFQLLVAVVLSAQTTDVSVNKVTPALFEKAPDAAAMAALEPAEIETFIHSIGMYHTKAANISKLSRMLMEKYSGVVPGEFDLLVELPGVGRKTANVVLAEVFGQQRIAVDTHVFRLANRTGLVAESDALKTEQALMKVIPYEHWTRMHHALIWHGRRVCSARSPQCETCCIATICKKNGIK